MKNPITNSEYEYLVEEARQNGEELEQYEDASSTFLLPKKVGNGGTCDFQLRHGCVIHIKDGQLWHPLCLDSYIPESQGLVLGFHLSNNIRIINPGLKEEEDREEGWGDICISYMQNIQIVEHFPSEQQIQCILIGIDLEVLRSFSAGWNMLPVVVQKLIEDKEVENFHQSLGTTDSDMKRILKDILNCSYQGIIRQMHLEGKMLELLSLMLIKWTEYEGQIPQKPKLCQIDVERLYLAKDIMSKSLEHPPSLLELARQVEVNDHKLKWGFRHLFGMSVFEYLHSCQMQQAKKFLVETQLSITEIAHMVGYASLPSFSGAFRKRFGTNPREYRDRQK